MSILTPPSSMTPGISKPASSSPTPAPIRQELALPKCFGTDYFGKWSTTGMTFEAMKIDRPDYQSKCATCPLLERCYLVNHIRILRIKR